jgi:hypothetical protein
MSVQLIVANSIGCRFEWPRLLSSCRATGLIPQLLTQRWMSCQRRDTVAANCALTTCAGIKFEREEIAGDKLILHLF